MYIHIAHFNILNAVKPVSVRHTPAIAIYRKNDTLMEIVAQDFQRAIVNHVYLAPTCRGQPQNVRLQL